MLAWKDVTSWSQGDPYPRPEPRTWEVEIGALRLCLHHHIADMSKWFVTCEPFFSVKEIGNVGDDVEALKQEALARVSQKIDDVRGAISALSN